MGIVALAAMTLCSCEDLLDTKNYTQSNTQNFPTSMDDVEMLVTSMYANLNHQAAKPESSYCSPTSMPATICLPEVKMRNSTI